MFLERTSKLLYIFLLLFVIFLSSLKASLLPVFKLSFVMFLLYPGTQTDHTALGKLRKQPQSLTAVKAESKNKKICSGLTDFPAQRVELVHLASSELSQDISYLMFASNKIMQLRFTFVHISKV